MLPVANGFPHPDETTSGQEHRIPPLATMSTMSYVKITELPNNEYLLYDNIFIYDIKHMPLNRHNF